VNFLKQTAIRLGWALILLTAVVVLNFTLIHIAPGDIADTIAGDMGGATAEVLAQIRTDYGLDRPFIVQLGIYLGNVARFDFGYSFFFNTSVTSLIAERLPATLLLVFTRREGRTGRSAILSHCLRCSAIRPRCSGPASCF